MSKKEEKTIRVSGSQDAQEARAARWAFLRRPPKFLNTIMSRIESPKILKQVRPHIETGQVVADLGCGWGFYTFALADLVGPQGTVYSVDLSKNCIQTIQKKADKRGYHNIRAFASTAANLSFIQDRSVDFVFANGLLCSMELDRGSAVQEMKRILKPGKKAYVSLGAPPPFGLVNQVEWETILNQFRLVDGGKFQDLWAVVSVVQ